MKCVVIYFSVNGNTEKVAKAIQAGVQRTAGHCDIFRIHEIDPRRLYEYDLIGLGCPIHGFAEPSIVKTFIKNMRLVGGKHVFPFATHGTVPEFFFPSIVPKLKRRGLVVIGMYNCYAAVFMLNSPNPYPTDGHPDEIDLQEAEEFGSEMVKRSQRISAGETGLIPQMPKWANPNLKKYITDRDKVEEKLGIKATMQPVRRAGPMIEYHKEKCNYPKCRLCMISCPVYGIDLTVKTPVIAKPCIGCGLCTLVCPTGAIERPAMIPAEAIINRWKALLKPYYLDPLEKAESEGRFRRLVPVEKIGLDNPLSKEHNKYKNNVKYIRSSLTGKASEERDK